jgi:hypothetical protein
MLTRTSLWPIAVSTAILALAVTALVAADTAATRGLVDPVLAGAGDIACDPDDPAYNGGAGTATECRQRYTSDILVNGAFTGVLTFGDNQYGATLAKFTVSYDASWGRVKSITRPAAGNHEYNAFGADGYFDYFNGVGSFTGPAGDRDKGYYSYDIGAWHMVVVNSNCQQVGGCGTNSAQYKWLKADLFATGASCVAATWHHPRFTIGPHGQENTIKPIWQLLYDRNADLILQGHDHNYQRWAPLNPSGARDNVRGIRSFVVGTGGKDLTVPSRSNANVEAQQHDTYGVLKLALHATSYDWEFVPEAGKTYTDSGSTACH